MVIKDFFEDFKDIDLNSLLESEPVYLTWEAGVYHTNRDCAKEAAKKDVLYKVPLELAEWRDYKLCDKKLGKHLCNAAE